MLPQRLPDAEFEIMEYIWDATPPVTTSQAMESVGRAHGWKIQTLATLFKRLTERGFLRAERGTGRERAFYSHLIWNGKTAVKQCLVSVESSMICFCPMPTKIKLCTSMRYMPL